MQRVHIIKDIIVIKSYTSCRSCALCYDEYYDIKVLKISKGIQEILFKNVGG
jgi:hypothetical protein